MTGHLTALYRHPIKGIGRERLDEATLAAGRPLPGDRAWALLHDNAADDSDEWQPRRNFLVVASAPKLAQIEAHSRATRIRLMHPDRPTLDLDPAEDGAALIDWIAPLWPDDRPQPRRLVKAPPQGMADNGAAQVAILNLSSLRALSEKVGKPLAVERFRGNLVLDGLAPWEEFDWVGKTVGMGGVRFEVTDRIERCRATEANPATGVRDANTLRALEDGWGHRDFGVYATVATDGRVATGDAVAA